MTQIIAVILSISGYYLTAKKNRMGFLCWFAGNSIWFFVDINAKLYWQGLTLIIYNVFAVIAFLKWRKS